MIFAETGLVVFPFLPGDSILFIAGTVVAATDLNVHLLVVVLIRRGVGRHGQLLGRALRRATRVRQARFALVQAGSPAAYAGVLRQLRRRHDHHRPLRADHPDVRAVPRRRRGDALRRFLGYNVVGAVAWVGSLVYAGYLFGNIPWVKDNLTLIVFGIVVVSLIPAITTFIQERRSGRRRK